MDEFNQAILLNMYPESLVNYVGGNKMLQFSPDVGIKMVISY